MAHPYLFQLLLKHMRIFILKAKIGIQLTVYVYYPFNYLFLKISNYNIDKKIQTISSIPLYDLFQSFRDLPLDLQELQVQWIAFFSVLHLVF